MMVSSLDISVAHACRVSSPIDREIHQFHSTAARARSRVTHGPAGLQTWLSRRSDRIGEQRREIFGRTRGGMDWPRALGSLVVPLNRNGVKLAEHSRGQQTGEDGKLRSFYVHLLDAK